MNSDASTSSVTATEDSSEDSSLLEPSSTALGVVDAGAARDAEASEPSDGLLLDASNGVGMDSEFQPTTTLDAGVYTNGVGEVDANEQLDASSRAELLNLTVTLGTLMPSFAPGIELFDVTVPVHVQHLTLTPTVADGINITILGATVVSGEAWTTPALDLGVTEFVLLIEGEGYLTTEHTLRVMRGADLSTYLKGSNTAEGDEFGISVAVSADGTTLAIGSHAEDSASNTIGVGQANDEEPGSGAVYVFTRSGNTWVQQAYLKASNGDEGDSFGRALALSSDGDTLVVGAHVEASDAEGADGDQSNNDAPGAGAAYVFERSGTGWSQRAYLKSLNSQAGDFFGCSVALSGDATTIVVGAYTESGDGNGVDANPDDNSAPGAGAVYVFRRTSTGWSQPTYVKAPNSDANDQFGSSVAVSEDGRTIVVGAPGEASGSNTIDGDTANEDAMGAGAVYVYGLTGDSWTSQAYIKGFNSDAGDKFGRSVGLSGDGRRLAVGAIGESSGANGVDGDSVDNEQFGAGAVYVFESADKLWTQAAYLKASNSHEGGQFGSSLSLASNGRVLAVGAPGEWSDSDGVGGNQQDSEAPSSGAVYVFELADGSWTSPVYVKATNSEGSDLFGATVALNASGNTLLVGAPLEDSAAVGVGGSQTNNDALIAGAAYVFR